MLSVAEFPLCGLCGGALGVLLYLLLGRRIEAVLTDLQRNLVVLACGFIITSSCMALMWSMKDAVSSDLVSVALSGLGMGFLFPLADNPRQPKS